MARSGSRVLPLSAIGGQTPSRNTCSEASTRD